MIQPQSSEGYVFRGLRSRINLPGEEKSRIMYKQNLSIDRSPAFQLFTLTRLPVVLEHEAVGAQAKHSTHCRQTRVGASGVVNTAWTRVPVTLTRVIVGGQRRVLQTLAGAFISSYEISTSVLAGTVTVVQ